MTEEKKSLGEIVRKEIGWGALYGATSAIIYSALGSESFSERFKEDGLYVGLGGMGLYMVIKVVSHKIKEE